MGLLDLLKSKETKYEEQVGKMDGIMIQELLELVPLEMKRMLLSEVTGVDYNPPKEQQERMAKLLDEAQKRPAGEKLELLTKDRDELYSLSRKREKVEVCSFLQSKWQEIEEHYGKKITGDVPYSVTRPFLIGNCTHSDVIKEAEQSDDVALMGALAYTLLLDAHKKGNNFISRFCEQKITLEAKRPQKLAQSYSTTLQNLDEKRVSNEKQEAAEKARVAAILGNGR